MKDYQRHWCLLCGHREASLLEIQKRAPPSSGYDKDAEMDLEKYKKSVLEEISNALIGHPDRSV